MNWQILPDPGAVRAFEAARHVATEICPELASTLDELDESARLHIGAVVLMGEGLRQGILSLPPKRSRKELRERLKTRAKTMEGPEDFREEVMAVATTAERIGSNLSRSLLLDACWERWNWLGLGRKHGHRSGLYTAFVEAVFRASRMGKPPSGVQAHGSRRNNLSHRGV